MNNKNEILATEPIGKLFLKLSIPAILAQLVNLLYNIVLLNKVFSTNRDGDRLYLQARLPTA